MLASTPRERGRIGRMIALITLAAALSGCAGVTFYSDPALKQRTGLKYYIAKPYLLVTRNAAKDTPLKVDVIQLPDLENPNYAVYKPGWGTHEFALKVSNGILTEFNQKADSKGPETIGAIADLASKAGAGFGSAATGLASLQKQAADIKASVGAINLAVGNLSAASALHASSKEAKDINTAMEDLKKVALAIGAGNTDQKARLEEIKARIGAITIDASIPDAAKIKGLLAAAQTQIDNAIAALTSGTSTVTVELPPASYELYEIRMENGETLLVRVKITKSSLKVIQQYGRPYGK